MFQLNKENPLYLYSYVSELFMLCILLCIIFYKTNCTIGLYTCIIFITILCLFYRNNFTLMERNNKSFISPSSSKVVEIKKTNRYNIVSTYLSPFNKHFMIAPCDCVVINKIYKPQRKTDSECMRHIMQDNNGHVFYLDQIVSKPLHWGWIPSVLYNRCVSFVNVGQKLKQGERYGLIRFGSNMEYGIPHNYNLHIKKSEKIDMGSNIATL